MNYLTICLNYTSYLNIGPEKLFNLFTGYQLSSACCGIIISSLGQKSRTVPKSLWFFVHRFLSCLLSVVQLSCLVSVVSVVSEHLLHFQMSYMGKNGTIMFQEDLDVAVGHAGEICFTVFFHFFRFLNQFEELFEAAAFAEFPDFQKDRVDFPGLVSMMVDSDMRAIAGVSAKEYKEGIRADSK